MRRTLLFTVAAVVACARGGDAPSDSAAVPAADSARVVVVDEAFVTPLDTVANVDGPAFWHRPDSTTWILATAKATDVVIAYDAATGRVQRTFSGPGTGAGRLDRPNGIRVLDDSLVVIVERDNHRVQVFALPDLAPRGTFGDRDLVKPYGLSVVADGPAAYTVYVTDSYELVEDSIPPDSALGRRVRQYRMEVGGPRVRATLVRTFGDTAGLGALRIVESIYADPGHDRLLVAEEDERDSHVKVYDLAGRFTGTLVGRGAFPHQAEGIALYACGARDGYWVMTDQAAAISTFLVFDRATLRLVGSFRGRQTNTTDGVALTQRGFGPFPAGAFAASHSDAGIAVFSWAAIADALGLRRDCGT
jgi:3-phytase